MPKTHGGRGFELNLDEMTKKKKISLDEGDTGDEKQIQFFGFIFFDPLHPG